MLAIIALILGIALVWVLLPGEDQQVCWSKTDEMESYPLGTYIMGELNMTITTQQVRLISIEFYTNAATPPSNYVNITLNLDGIPFWTGQAGGLTSTPVNHTQQFPSFPVGSHNITVSIYSTNGATLYNTLLRVCFAYTS